MKRLRELIREKDGTNIAFSKNIGIHANTIAQYCTGKRTPRLKDIIKIADYFDVSIDYLVGRSDER